MGEGGKEECVGVCHSLAGSARQIEKSYRSGIGFVQA